MSFCPIDLHSHSTASDGLLTPTELVQRASGRGVRVLALTDHDSVAGIEEAAVAARDHGVTLIAGAEFSVGWAHRDCHVVGLFIDPAAPALDAHIRRQTARRQARAEAIGARLERLGLGAVRERARIPAPGGVPTRAHFARALVAEGRVANVQAAFKHYLARGRPAYVATDWPGLEETVAVIRTAGGAAVLAHPYAYRLSGAWMRRLLSAFVAAGGEGIEVCCGGGGPGARESAAHYAHRYGLKASVGSDFHDPGRRWNDLGGLAPLPATLVPVWRGRLITDLALPGLDPLS